MRDEQPQLSLVELWARVCDERKRIDVQAVQLAALQLADFVTSTQQIVAVAEEMQRIAKQTHMAHVVRLESDLRQFVAAATRAAEVARELQLALVGAELAPLAGLTAMSPDGEVPAIEAGIMPSTPDIAGNDDDRRREGRHHG